MAYGRTNCKKMAEELICKQPGVIKFLVKVSMGSISSDANLIQDLLGFDSGNGFIN